MKAAERLGGIELDRVVHEKARLMILTYLSSSSEPESGFTELRDALGMTGGNLSIQLRNLEEAGYISIAKRYEDNRPYTGVRLSQSGKDALERYISEMETIVASVRAPKPGKGTE